MFQGNVRFEQATAFGNHPFLTTAHISYLNSAVYALGEGIVGPQDAYGVEAGTTAEQFFNNVILVDSGMMVKFFNADNSPKAMDAVMAVNDYVWLIRPTVWILYNTSLKPLGPNDIAP